jgi:F-type H+-transporting ATPase subunit a
MVEGVRTFFCFEKKKSYFMTGIHVSISAETIFHLGSIPVTNSMFASLIISAFLIGFAVITRLKLQNTDKPTGIQNVAEWLVETLHNLVFSVTGDLKKSARFFGPVATFFIFILLNNWFGLLPGFGTIGFTHSPEPKEIVVEESALLVPAEEIIEPEIIAEDHSVKTPEILTEVEPAETTKSDESHDKGVFVPYLRAGTADLNTTIALALISFTLIQIFGVQYSHLGYFKKFFNFSSPIDFFVGVLELISEIGKIISFAFRLFGNVFAGEVLLVVISALVPILIPMPFYGLEIFVGLVQALVFAMLSLVFYNIATQHH